MATTYLTVNPIFHAKTKHITMHYHFVRELIDKKQMKVKFEASMDQLVDILTKALLKTTFQYLRDKLIKSLPLSMRGSVKD